MTYSYPDDTLQGVISTSNNPWWKKDPMPPLCRGRLLWAFLPHVGKEPYTLTPVARSEPTNHNTVQYELGTLSARSRATKTLPVAGLPQYDGEVYTLHAAKKRPAIVICANDGNLPSRFRNAAAWQTSPTVLVAPYYGSDHNGSRGGWNSELVRRIKQCEYSQYMWDRLPVGDTESILRLDHIQPIGNSIASYDLSEYRLSDDALDIFNEWLDWYFYNELPQSAVLWDFKQQAAKEYGASHNAPLP